MDWMNPISSMNQTIRMIPRNPVHEMYLTSQGWRLIRLFQVYWMCLQHQSNQLSRAYLSIQGRQGNQPIQLRRTCR
jgi:hypothetical protein